MRPPVDSSGIGGGPQLVFQIPHSASGMNTPARRDITQHPFSSNFRTNQFNPVNEEEATVDVNYMLGN
jgi:hypothetical protein